MPDIDSEKKAGPSPLVPNQHKNRSSRQTRLTVWLSVILFTSTLLLLAITSPHSIRNRLTLWPVDKTPDQGGVSSEVEGDEYLLGVGKADITGYAADELFVSVLFQFS